MTKEQHGANHWNSTETTHKIQCGAVKEHVQYLFRKDWSSLGTLPIERTARSYKGLKKNQWWHTLTYHYLSLFVSKLPVLHLYIHHRVSTFFQQQLVDVTWSDGKLASTMGIHSWSINFCLGLLFCLGNWCFCGTIQDGWWENASGRGWGRGKNNNTQHRFDTITKPMQNGLDRTR